MMNNIDELFELEPYSLRSNDKNKWQAEQLRFLNEHHKQHCPPYGNIIANICQSPLASSLESYPYISSQLFKTMNLSSIIAEDKIKTLTSSGTSGASLSRIELDGMTARLQAKALVKTLQPFTSIKRLPMLIIEPRNLIKNRLEFSARGAGVQGVALMGRDHHYALNEDMSLNLDIVKQFYEKYKHQRVLIFGFTFMVWRYFTSALGKMGVSFDFMDAVLLHSGGWKKLEQEKVTDSEFKRRLASVLGYVKVHNFYGMVEQTGSIFVECEYGHLHCSNFNNVVIRCQKTLGVLGKLEKGIIQVMSMLPLSYPGHNLLTEDLGKLLGEDDCPCGKNGRYFKVYGRIKNAQNKGCSNTYEG
ncbi:acyl-protein synthetase [Psychrobium sp. MM17-31]|uniref:LuxE/PaaK family acyltransferase n=1 Tax=Psychrobium sp. MM17-31 TaxID=2917758 RepID=UPI001EF7486F|nr:acyl-protein synthetase [Psychrobium sp. MM17-31]MCG7530109.1 acyl-protein synthetase [Psychrobium sp. MM17-31]